MTANRKATRADVQTWLKSQGATELMNPGEIMIVDAVPILGTGKLDFAGLGKLVKERLAAVAA